MPLQKVYFANNSGVTMINFESCARSFYKTNYSPGNSVDFASVTSVV